MSNKIYVSEMEYEALVNLDKMIRIAMSVPSTGDMLIGAIQALDHVRMDEGIAIPESTPVETEPLITGVSDLAAALIKRSMDRQ